MNTHVLTAVMLSCAMVSCEHPQENVTATDPMPTPETSINNAELERAIESIRDDISMASAEHFYDVLRTSSLFLAQTDVRAPVGPNRTSANAANPVPVLTTNGPDGRVWLPAFTSVQRLRVRFPDARGFVALAAPAVAQMQLGNATGGGIVLNPGINDADGQPVERRGLEALVRGGMPE